VLVVLAVTLWSRLPWTRPAAPAPSPPPALSMSTLVDSVKQTEGRGDWERALGYVQAIADANPRSAIALLALAKSWTNYSWGGQAYARSRGATRTSLDRVRILRHALALDDSATALATTDQERVMSRVQKGRMLELAGMPMDALYLYAEARNIDSTDRELTGRIRSTLALLHDSRAVAAGTEGGSADR
jgi:hypothetical protein